MSRRPIRSSETQVIFSPESPRYDRTCWVCLGSEKEDDAGPVPKDWVRPCRCRGTTKWVHQACLQRWIDEKQAGNAAAPVLCSQCRTQYRIVCSKLGPLFECFEEYEKIIDAFSPLATAFLVLGGVGWCANRFGMLSLTQTLGSGATAALLENRDPVLIHVTVPLIPFVLAGSRFIDWHTYGLRLYWWSQCQLKRFVLGDDGCGRNEAEANSTSRMREPAELKSSSDAATITRRVMGGLLLPTCAAVCGQLLFDGLIEEQWKKSLLGGFVYVLGKGIVKMMYRHQQYVRQASRTILSWDES